MENGSIGTIKIIGNTKIGFKEWIIFEGDEATLEIKEGMRLIPKSGKPQEILRKIPEGYPKSKVDQIVRLVRGDYSVNYTSGINGVCTSWLTNAIIQSGKGPEEKNTVDCDELIENEGFSRHFVKDLIAESEEKNML
jgi:hypothetical protein